MNLWENLGQLFTSLGFVIGDLLQFLLQWSLLIVWLAWWLWAVNWQKLWPVLARGAWVALVLLMVAAALAWSQIAPGQATVLGFLTLANFWWQLGVVVLIVAGMLFCGWVQTYFGWTPPEIDLSAVVPGTGHEHPVGTFHGHEAAHADDHP